MLLCDQGADAGLGVARALRLIGLLNSFEGKSVTAEGAFRAVLDRYEALLPLLLQPAVQAPPGAGASASGSAVEALPRLWQPCPAPYKAHLSATLQAHGALLSQWDKRGAEAARASAAARALLGSAVQQWQCQGAAQQQQEEEGKASKAGFLAQATLAAAFTTAHVGSWGMNLPQDLGEL